MSLCARFASASGIAGLLPLAIMIGCSSKHESGCFEGCTQPTFTVQFNAQPADVVSGSIEICLEADCRSGSWDLTPRSDAPPTYAGTFPGGELKLRAIAPNSAELFMIFWDPIPEGAPLELHVTALDAGGSTLLDVKRYGDTTLRDRDGCVYCQGGFGSLDVSNDAGADAS